MITVSRQSPRRADPPSGPLSRLDDFRHQTTRAATDATPPGPLPCGRPTRSRVTEVDHGRSGRRCETDLPAHEPRNESESRE